MSRREEKLLETLRLWKRSPIAFIGSMWGLIPQPLKPEYTEQFQEVLRQGKFGEVRGDWFQEFKRGQHISWQQWLVLLGVERAIRKEAPKRISVASGKGIGKTAVFAWVILWFLFTHKDAMVPCTANTGPQLFDVLWKELSKWIQAMPPAAKAKFDWTQTHLRIVDRPQTWFATARTARRENPEAFAGFHADNIMAVGDESSGIPEEVFDAAKGILTSPNAWFIMFSNPTRLVGYFYDTHFKETMFADWQRFQFSAVESPIADSEYARQLIAEKGVDSDDYRIFILGQFPRADAMDDRGYVPLLMESDLVFVADTGKFAKPRLGVDPAGEGVNETVWVLRDQFRAKIITKEAVSVPKSIAAKTLTLADYYGVEPGHIFIDSFGVGTNVCQELWNLAAGFRVTPVNVGDQADDSERYLNKRAECFWRLKEWLRSGGEFVRHDDWKQLLSLRFRRMDRSGRIQIMDKTTMRREGIQSPDAADAISLSFASPTTFFSNEEEEAILSVSDIYSHR